MEKEKAVTAVMVMVIASMEFLVSATNHTVGGATGWDLSSDIRRWSANTSFHAGDFLVFNYTPLHDVMEVNRTEFAACKTIDPIGVYTDGETVVQLSQPGVTRYFICGRADHCSLGLKLRVRVLQKAANSASPTRGGRGRESQPRRSRQPPTHPNPKNNPCDPGPNSSAWGGGRERILQGWRWLSPGFLAMALVILRLSL